MTAPKKGARIHRIDEGDWLHRLLAGAHKRIAAQPSPQAIERIRRRLQAALRTPTRAAA